MEDISQSLGRIAALLEERVALAQRSQEYLESRDERTTERFQGFSQQLESRIPKIEVPEFEFDQQEHRAQMARLEERSLKESQDRHAFHERVCGALERQNELLERIAVRLEHLPGTADR